jgi:hypothetical protein
MYCDLFNIVYIFVFHFINIFIVYNRFENIYIFSKTLFSVTVIDNENNNGTKHFNYKPSIYRTYGSPHSKWIRYPLHQRGCLVHKKDQILSKNLHEILLNSYKYQEITNIYLQDNLFGVVDIAFTSNVCYYRLNHCRIKSLTRSLVQLLIKKIVQQI